MAPTDDATHGIVHNEGCDLHYWHVGTGRKLILFVPGGNGHGRQFNNIMSALALSGKFTCATFDRRQMSSSQPTPPNKPQRLSPPQQARDIHAVIQTISGPDSKFPKAILFGSSSGGIFAYQFAHDYPEMVDHLIAHESAIISLLPDGNEVFEWFLHLIDVYETQGLDAAAAEFGERLIGYDDEGVVPTVPPEKENPANFWEHEFRSLLGYTPNFFKIKEDGTSIGVMRGVRCRDAFYARAADEQAKVLECPFMVVPGHHQGFECETEKFLPRFLEMLDILEEKKNGKGVGGTM